LITHLQSFLAVFSGLAVFVLPMSEARVEGAGAEMIGVPAGAG
jgi:hypothetical protein